MGGEQYSVLLFGPKQSYTVFEWLQRFSLINKKKWVKNFLENKKHSYTEGYDTDDEEGIDIVFDQDFSVDEANEILLNFLENNQMCMAYNNNVCWDDIFIGFKVDEYESFNDNQKQIVEQFCKKYNLSNPTFYAGIIGEY